MLVLKLLIFRYYYFIWNLGSNNCNRTLMYVGDESRPFVVLDGLSGLYRLKYDSATACGLPTCALIN